MDKIKLTSWDEFILLEKKGFVPLLNPSYCMDIALRVDIQNKFFGKTSLGKGSQKKANQKFYEYIWNVKQHHCEETYQSLNYYSAAFVSHILSRGAFPEMALDPRNVNLLSFEAHQRWETGDRKGMRIYLKNLETIETLKTDYSRL